MSDVTHILTAIGQGDPLAAEKLLPLVYDELRRLAASKLAHEQSGQTLQATALVHEAYLRLVNPGESSHWNGRGHFFAAAAEAMRRILVDRARCRSAAKRGGQVSRENLDPDAISVPGPDDEVLAVHEALDALAATDPDAALLVKLRFFAGMTMEDAAGALGISVRSAYGLWAYARTVLHRQIRPE